MLSRLGKAGRLKAGWCIALAYLFCVLAPSLSFALADGSIQAPCIVEDHGPGIHMHEMAAGPHIHHGDHPHDPSSHASSTVDGVLTGYKDAAYPVKGSQKTDDARCCGLISLSAIPAGEIVLFKPFAPKLRLAAENYRDVAETALPTLYRPPIS